MSLITRLPAIIEACRNEYETRKALPPAKRQTSFQLTEKMSFTGTTVKMACETAAGIAATEPGNMLAAGDNQAFMEWLLWERSMTEKLNLIYVDPPYFSNASYSAGVKMNSTSQAAGLRQAAYADVWHSADDYLTFLIYRLLLMRDLLAEDGVIWVHLDWHIVHYVKVVMDEIFGEKNFINEVIWTYKSGGAGKRHFARKHDTLLYYGKSGSYYFKPLKEKSYNRGLRPYRFKGVEEFQDEVGWYTMVSQKDVWQIDMVGRTSAERTGYGTQKPEQLLRRILESCTKEGDLCADFFGGSGTLAAVCAKLDRRFIHCDLGAVSEISTKKRLGRIGCSYLVYRQNGIDKVGGKIHTKMSLQRDVPSGKMNISVELTSYKSPHAKAPPVDKKDLAKAKQAMRQDPLSIVDFWCVDWDYDGQVFCPGFQAAAEEEENWNKAEKMVDEFRQVAVKVYDVFGGSAMEVLTLE